jgi:chorismate mutase/prephenate dehydratase
MNDSEKLAELRRQIDTVDEQIVAWLNERARLALQLGILKSQDGKAIEQPDREEAVLKHISKVTQGPLSDEGLRAIFKTIIKVCRTIQFNK